MGEGSVCNYCALNRMRRDAKKNGERIVMVPAKGLGVNVHRLKAQYEKPTEKNLCCWFMELSEMCQCW